VPFARWKGELVIKAPSPPEVILIIKRPSNGPFVNGVPKISRWRQSKKTRISFRGPSRNPRRDGARKKVRLPVKARGCCPLFHPVLLGDQEKKLVQRRFTRMMS